MNDLTLWIIFAAVVIPAFVIDLRSHKEDRVVEWREATLWSVAWIFLAICYGMLFFWRGGWGQVAEYFTSYVLEKSLSIDNLFVFTVAFNFFLVPRKFRHRILFWGVVGAIVTRAIFITGGVALVHKFSWMLYVFGAFLLIVSAKLAFFNKEEKNKEFHENGLVRFIKRVVPVTEHWVHDFFVTIENKFHVTPIFIVLLTIESTDVLFALDSVPAIFGVTTDSLIIYTSNIFAVLGLRSLYFLLEHILDKFRYLATGVNIILFFIGIKLILHDAVHIPTGWTLFVIVVVFAVSIIASLRKPEELET